MKLNYKRVFFVSLAFFLITMFWQCYDSIVPMTLTNKFGMPQTVSGIVMALDNVVALFLLPFFGSLSDRYHKSKLGRRTPFILVGTVIACVLFVVLSFADNWQLTNINNVSDVGSQKTLSVLYQSDAATEPLIISDKDGKTKLSLRDIYTTEEEFLNINVYVPDTQKILSDIYNSDSADQLIFEDGTKSLKDIYASEKDFLKITEFDASNMKEAFSAIYNSDIANELILENGTRSLKNIYNNEEEFVKYSKENAYDYTSDYSENVIPVRKAYAWQQTLSNPAPLILFVIILFFLLLSMSTFRSPAVALMPDVVPKPLRSKANAVINLMGTFAGAIVLVLGMVFGTGKSTQNIDSSYMSYSLFFAVIAGLMLIALAVFMFTVKETKWAAEAKQISEKAGLEKEETETSSEVGKRHLSKGEMCSLIFLLASVAFWFIGYNAVTSKYTVYAGEILKKDYNVTLFVALAVATVAFLPVAFISSRLGRKKVILIGVGLLTFSFASASFINSESSIWLINALFAIAGIGWACINVNSFPMVVELATGSDVGRYTGFYYAASMSAQAIAPPISGIFLDGISMRALFPFGTIAVTLSFITMLFVKHGDSKPLMKKDLLDNMEDAD